MRFKEKIAATCTLTYSNNFVQQTYTVKERPKTGNNITKCPEIAIYQ